MKTLKAGETIYAKTNAELLNTLLGTDYKRYMKAYRFLRTGEMLWMPRLDGKVRSGWRNIMQNGHIIEEYVGGQPYPREIDMGLVARRRIVFEKCDWGKYFVFRGVFELEQGSTLLRRVLEFVSDEITL